MTYCARSYEMLFIVCVVMICTMKIEKDVSLKDKNWFCTGGKAEFFCRPLTEDDFLEGLRFASTNNLSLTVLGEGANILISDEGISGLVIRPRINHLIIDKTKGIVIAGAGICMRDVIDASIDQGLIGLEEFSGIPGTVGGSVYINIHFFLSIC